MMQGPPDSPSPRVTQGPQDLTEAPVMQGPPDLPDARLMHGGGDTPESQPRAGRPDIPGLVGALATVALGFLLLLDRLEVLHLGFGWLWPALLATLGAFLLASGLARPRG